MVSEEKIKLKNFYWNFFVWFSNLNFCWFCDFPSNISKKFIFCSSTQNLNQSFKLFIKFLQLFNFLFSCLFNKFGWEENPNGKNLDSWSRLAFRGQNFFGVSHSYLLLGLIGVQKIYVRKKNHIIFIWFFMVLAHSGVFVGDLSEIWEFCS